MGRRWGGRGSCKPSCNPRASDRLPILPLSLSPPRQVCWCYTNQTIRLPKRLIPGIFNRLDCSGPVQGLNTSRYLSSPSQLANHVKRATGRVILRTKKLIGSESKLATNGVLRKDGILVSVWLWLLAAGGVLWHWESIWGRSGALAQPRGLRGRLPLGELWVIAQPTMPAAQSHQRWGREKPHLWGWKNPYLKPQKSTFRAIVESALCASTKRGGKWVQTIPWEREIGVQRFGYL